MAEKLKYAANSLVLSYSIIFFSKSRLLGLFVIAATMVFPSHGVFGIIGGVLSNGCAYAVGFDRQMIRKGLYGFNGVLVGLGLGFFYHMSVQMVFILFIVSVVVVFLTALLNQLFGASFGLPSLSMPFTLVAWLVGLASLGFGYLQPPYGRLALFRMPLEGLPDWTNTYLISFGALLFQLNTVSGIIIALGILIYSRIAFILMTAGFVFAIWMHRFLGIDASLIGEKCLGFNYMLAALAIGAVFCIPGPGSFIAGLLATALSVLILVAASIVFPAYLSPLALPFNLAVMLVLYALKARLYPSLGVVLATDTSLAPEENLTRHRKSILQWKRWGVAISLPFHGRWQVTQGIDGWPTHREKLEFRL